MITAEVKYSINFARPWKKLFALALKWKPHFFKFDGRKCNSNQKWESGITINFDVSAKIRENFMCAEKIIFGVLVHVLMKMVNI